MSGYTRELYYQTQLSRKTDDIKHTLGRSLYQLNTISYNKGSRKGDYEIRDAVESLNQQIHVFSEYVKFFDNAKNGDFDAYQEILVFFQNSFLDYDAVEERLNTLIQAINSQKKLDELHNKNHTGSGKERKKNIYLIEAESKVESFKNTFYNTTSVILRQFLSCINLLYFFEKLQAVCNSNFHKRTGTNELKDILLNYSYTLIHIAYKISGNPHNREQAKDYLKKTLQESGMDHIIQDSSGISHNTLMEIIKEAAQTLEEHVSSLEDEVDTNQDQNERRVSEYYTAVKAKSDIKALLEKLTYISTQKINTDVLQQYGDYNLAQKKKSRFVFEQNGSYDITLKTVVDYHIDSVIFIYAWVYHEIHKNRALFEKLDPFIRILDMSSKLGDYTSAAIRTAGRKDNQKNSLSGMKTTKYVPFQLAETLGNHTRSHCEALESAFVECELSLSDNASAKEASLRKKIHIIHGSFNESKSRILRQLYTLEI